MLQGSHQECRCLVVRDVNPHGGREQEKTDRQAGEDMAAALPPREKSLATQAGSPTFPAQGSSRYLGCFSE